MTWIKVGLMPLPHMLREILTDAMGKANDIKVVDVPAVQERLTPQESVGLDAFVIASNDGDRDAICRILVESPEIAILAVSRDAKFAHIYELYHEAIGEPSADTILAALRRAVHRRRSLRPIGD